jgi:hypothetical protein
VVRKRKVENNNKKKKKNTQLGLEVERAQLSWHRYLLSGTEMTLHHNLVTVAPFPTKPSIEQRSHHQHPLISFL